MTTERFERLPLTSVQESKLNPRVHFDPVKLEELALSIREKGIIEPIVVRAKGPRYEIVAGARRFRASKLAEQPDIPAVIRDYSDEQVLELQMIENIQRDDLTALEQARGYKALIDANPDKHTAASIATRVGMSEAWVWDRLKLNDLIPEAKALLEQERIATGHGILIARQKPDDQKRIIDPDGAQNTIRRRQQLGRLADRSHCSGPGRRGEGQARQIRRPEGRVGARARALDCRPTSGSMSPTRRRPSRWNLRAVAERVKAAEEKPGRGKKVIPITFSYHVSDERARSERTHLRRAIMEARRRPGEIQDLRALRARAWSSRVSEQYGQAVRGLHRARQVPRPLR
jgi:ParB/RepB/Spo0J family partition protein